MTNRNRERPLTPEELNALDAEGVRAEHLRASLAITDIQAALDCAYAQNDKPSASWLRGIHAAKRRWLDYRDGDVARRLRRDKENARRRHLMSCTKRAQRLFRQVASEVLGEDKIAEIDAEVVRRLERAGHRGVGE